MKTLKKTIHRNNKTLKRNNNDIINFKNNKYNKLKELGKGLYGTTYLIKDNNITYAFKIQKILKEHIKKSTEFNIWRELEFNKNFIKKLNNKDKDFFIEIYEHKVINNCTHIQVRKNIPIFSNTPKKNTTNRIMYNYDKSKYCMYYLMEYVNGFTVYEYIINSLKENKNIPKKILLNIALQYLKSIQLLSSKGYGHNDEHHANMMLTTIPKNNKTFTLNNKTITKYKYQFKLIDYGLINNKKYIQTKNLGIYQIYEYMFFKNSKDDYYYYHCLYVLIYLFYDRSDYIYELHNKTDPYESVQYNLLDYTYKKIMVLHTDFFNNTINKYIKQYPETEKYMIEINRYVEYNNIKDIDIFTYAGYLLHKNKYKKHIYGLITIIIRKLLYTFQIIYPKLYLEYNSYKLIDKRIIQFPVNKEIGLQLLEFTTIDEIINYLTNYYLKLYK